MALRLKITNAAMPRLRGGRAGFSSCPCSRSAHLFRVGLTILMANTPPSRWRPVNRRVGRGASMVVTARQIPATSTFVSPHTDGAVRAVHPRQRAGMLLRVLAGRVRVRLALGSTILGLSTTVDDAHNGLLSTAKTNGVLVLPIVPVPTDDILLGGAECCGASRCPHLP